VAIYRLSAEVIRRSAGRTVTAAAAYRAGMQILDERTGLSFDYRGRQGVEDAAILAPPQAPGWMCDRSRLWNAVEQGERRKDAQLAREIVLALPHELTRAGRRDLAHRFVRVAFVDAGMVADIAIHRPDRGGDRRNHHVHILLTMRAIEGEAFGPKVRAWNDAALLEQWRALWAEHVNRALEQAGEKARVDHHSLEAQGAGRLAQIHLGAEVIEMERRGIATGRGELAREIAATNAVLAQAAPAPVETREQPAASIMPGRAISAPTAPPRGPQRHKSGGRIAALFRLARMLTFRCRMPAKLPRRRFAMPCRAPPAARTG
jgi:hypothetical protein